MSEVWTEKYRPRKLDDIVGQSHVTSRLKAWVAKGSIPNMLFAGPAGVGKTSASLALARELFGTNWRHNFNELNASDERGIEIVRGRIKEFAKTRPIGSAFKIIFLDESDALTPEAQQALRRTMEQFSGSTRFILSCNYSSRIIEPIQSRCAVFRFRMVEEKELEGYLKKIAEAEGLKLDAETLKAIYTVSEGDARKSVNLLQAASFTGNPAPETVYDIAAQAKPQDVRQLLELSLGGKFAEARKLLYQMLVTSGLSGQDIIRGIHKEIFSLEIPEKAKVEMVGLAGEFEFRLDQGGSDDIQLLALLAQFTKINAGKA